MVVKVLRTEGVVRGPVDIATDGDGESFVEVDAVNVPRREALRQLGAGLAGAVLAGLGRRPAMAAAPCPEKGFSCPASKGAFLCCAEDEFCCGCIGFPAFARCVKDRDACERVCRQLNRQPA